VRDRGPWTVRDREPSGIGPDRVQYSTRIISFLFLITKK
jgi:hypothetical protein